MTSKIKPLKRSKRKATLKAHFIPILLGAVLLINPVEAKPKAQSKAQDNKQEHQKKQEDKQKPLKNQTTVKNQVQANKQVVAKMTSKRISLSYITPDRCSTLLGSYGVKTAKAGQPLKPAQLPTVVQIPETKKSDLPSDVEGNFPPTATDPIHQLMVFYDANEPRQYRQVLDIIRNQIDLPSRQILIEAMVLEISEQSLKQLGVEWRLANPSGGNFFGKHVSDDLILGNISAASLSESSQLDINLKNIFREFNTRLRALLRTNNAKILSRPSILTLNNRMAHISIGKEIPVAESKFSKNQDIEAVDFRQVKTGIKLNVRPRVSSNGDTISMQVIASVRATVPGEDVTVKASDGTILASSPTISDRQVRTQVQIANKTPFIIGGLISKDNTREESKVPLLGDIPFIKSLFRSQDNYNKKREVIIVITPYLMPQLKLAQRQLPKDTDDFDSAHNELFRDAYRIQEKDVFDLDFITDNQKLLTMQERTDAVLKQNPGLEESYPFSCFARGKIPGEEILVRRQMYEVIKRKLLGQKIDSSGIIYFRPNDNKETKFSVTFLDEKLKQIARKIAPPETKTDLIENPFAVLKQAEKALAISFTSKRHSGDTGDIFEEPIAETDLIDCPSKNAWTRELWQRNQSTGNLSRNTIILREKDDLMRLKRAIILKKAMRLNTDGENNLSLEEFSIGRILMLPDFDKKDVHLIDNEVAKYFFQTELYYPAVREEFHASSQALQKKLDEM